jgi:hypothetical protein
MKEIKNIFPRVYTDEKTERLSKEYDVRSCSDYPVSSSLGQYDEEIGAQKLLSISKYFGEFVGIDSKEISPKDSTKFRDYDFLYITYLDKKYVRTEKKDGLEILFPTEELLINQKVKKRK